MWIGLPRRASMDARHVDPRGDYVRQRGTRLRACRRASARRQRRLVNMLRRVANRRVPSDPAKRRRELLLHDRVVAVRTELLELADTLEQTPNPNPSTVASLHELLTDGCDSPLYNPEVHESELRATLYYALVGLSPLAANAESPGR